MWFPLAQKDPKVRRDDKQHTNVSESTLSRVSKSYKLYQKISHTYHHRTEPMSETYDYSKKFTRIHLFTALNLSPIPADECGYEENGSPKIVLYLYWPVEVDLNNKYLSGWKIVAIFEGKRTLLSQMSILNTQQYALDI